MGFTEEEAAKRRLLFEICRDRQALHDWVYTFLDVDLPGTIVDERSDSTPLDMVWDIYSHFVYPQEDAPAERLYYASRFGAKTLGMAIVEVLALLHLDTSVVHLAAIEQQSQDCQKYLKDFFYKPDLRGFMVGDNVRQTEVVFWRSSKEGDLVLTEREAKVLKDYDRRSYTRNAHRAEVVMATMQSVNGKHAGLLCLDEFDIVRDPRIIAESKNIPTPIRKKDGSFVDPLTVIVSTRKTGFGPVQRAIDDAPKTGLKVGHWNIMEVTQRCPASRHLPELPKIPIYHSDATLQAVDEATFNAMDVKGRDTYVRGEGYQGCLSKCKIFASCRGALATKPGDSEFLKPISDTVKKLRTNSLDTARSQLLCLKPSSVGLIYGHLLDQKHIVSPADAYHQVTGRDPPQGQGITKANLVDLLKPEEISWWGGQDYGYGHVFAFVVGFRFGNRMFVTRCLAAPELDPAQKLELSDPVKDLKPAVFGDPEDPGTIAFFHKHGWKMKQWRKLGGSVRMGIDIVKDKLMPATGVPELYFVRETGDDPETDHMLRMLREHHWKLDAGGRPTDIPDDEDKDIPDALRYMMMNVFPHKKGGLMSASDTQPSARGTSPPIGQSQEMRKIVDDLLSDGRPPPQTGDLDTKGIKFII